MDGTTGSAQSPPRTQTVPSRRSGSLEAPIRTSREGSFGTIWISAGVRASETLAAPASATAGTGRAETIGSDELRASASSLGGLLHL
jgi:hypothetical protein